MKLRQENRALSLRQLGAAYGLGYVRIKQMQALPGFPLIAGKVIPSDFDRWRLLQTGLSSLHRGDRLRSAADTTRALKLTSDSRVAWRQIENSLKAAVSSLGLPEGSGSSDV
ncbi:MAG: hypothetical protein ORN83_12735 [Chthoniobacteraceae bacterium]|nr:hypothetical protein [Chthoniobacteraceae bacterium]